MKQFVEYRGERYTVALRREFSIGAFKPWCIDVEHAWYQLTDDATEALDDARRFLRYSLRNVPRRSPPFVASKRYPLLLKVDEVAVRAWPQFVSRGTGATTFVHPTLNRRVGTEKPDPMWMFESAVRVASAGGSMTAEQTLDDVADLAKIWLRAT